MKLLLSIIASLVIVGGAYVWSFGVPSAIMPDADGALPAEQAQGGPAGFGGPPGGAGGPFGGGGTVVALTPLDTRPFEDVFRAIGNSEAIRSATVTADVSGRIIEVILTPNAEVKQGDVLVQLDARVAQLTLETAQSALEQATATVERYERLQESGNLTVSDVTLSDARLAQRQAEATVAQAELALEDLTIRAPISGRIGLSDVNVGDYLNANTAIVTIDDSGALLVEFELPERSVSLLALGREVTLETPSLTGRFFKGEITAFDSRIDEVTRSVTVQARVENPDGMLWPGMTFTAQVSTISEPLPVVPTTAITWSRDGASIWYENDGKAQSVPVAILHRRDELVWLDVDLPEGTMIVSEGAHKLRAGSAITDANSEPQQPDRAPT
ncbi:efflux RND transporter periplasmic adaptor subunit [Phaeovulum sp.]|uniref:efflux RND transporter periplasmic adaptor subunit n=1 Tax=Phaeovulum sp. TaxID=2934796 RepID=UPI0035690F32